MKVCLLRPPTVINVKSVTKYATPPVGLAYIAAAIRDAHYEVQIIDGIGEAVHQYSKIPERETGLLYGLKFEEIIERMHPATEVVGISTMFSRDWLSSKKLVEAVREAFPKVKIVMGGEHITACAEHSLQTCSALDVAVLGEGEETIIDLLNAIQTRRSLATVNGIVYREAGAIVRTQARKRLMKLDEIAEPAWDLFPLNEYIDNGFGHGFNMGRSAPILASRGCPYQCTFCSNPVMWNPVWKARSPRLVVDEMKKYIVQYNVTNFDFYDLTAIVKREWIIEFCQIIDAEKLNVTWQLPSGTRSEAIDAEVVSWLYRSGCRSINYAPESGSPEELKRMKKKISISKMLSSMSAAHKAKIRCKANIIFGMPGSTWKDVFYTYWFFIRMAWAGVNDVGCFSFSPYPGSEVFNDLIKSGRITLNQEYFERLNAFDNFMPGNSYSDKFTFRELSIINLVGMAIFYGASFLFRPQRFLNLIVSLIKKDDTNALTRAFSNIRRRRIAFSMINFNDNETVQLPQLYKPKTS